MHHSSRLGHHGSGSAHAQSIGGRQDGRVDRPHEWRAIHPRFGSGLARGRVRCVGRSVRRAWCAHRRSNRDTSDGVDPGSHHRRVPGSWRALRLDAHETTTRSNGAVVDRWPRRRGVASCDRRGRRLARRFPHSRANGPTRENVARRTARKLLPDFEDDPDLILAEIDHYRDVGVTHLVPEPRQRTLDGYLRAMERQAELLRAAGVAMEDM
jgi:hypothetical protein